ncbi:MAG TPA: helix-turn-helix transcriptional regulator [Oligoflexus sp.]|uniref:helix-turn-helix domain-containing protein n=1 Tax=Oligoflexus sp. TaxID=1971216 RepID=UPI002D7E9B14|nr:helix-turn-helix transcriptional regulator [Oligoflexus sp.]HET9236129.1 helix-turn-helix transcriptional regulator [Oligoflexus sp.]
MSLEKLVARNIVRIRTEKGISKQEFAKNLKVDTARLRKIEKGSNLTLGMIERLAKQLHVPPATLLAKPGTTEDDLPKTNTLATAALELTKQASELLETLIRTRE